MNEPGEYLKSVNWTTGMLLTPKHFLRQDNFMQEQVAWLLRYCVPGTGLVGGGVRLDPSDQGLGRHDPKIEIYSDSDSLQISVLRARGITPGGHLVEVDESRVLRAEVPRADLAGISDVLVHVVRMNAREPDPTSLGSDDANPNQAALARERYEVFLGIPADLGSQALVVGKLHRASETIGFELDTSYIPPCATLVAHSSLYSAALRLQAEVRLLVGEFQLVHEKAGNYAERVGARGVDVGGDIDIRAFVERAVLALETCAYETADLTMSPQRFFQQIERAGRLIALGLNLSSWTRQFFEKLGTVDVGYTKLLETEHDTLASQRELNRREELGSSIVRCTETLDRLRQLVEALAGKYVDYRINRLVESIRFLLDRDGEQFYESLNVPSHPQRDGDLLTFVFNQLESAGRHEYRIVLTGDPRASYQWGVGTPLSVTIRVNATGGPRPPMTQNVICDVEGQRNFAVNFDTPADVAAIAGLTVSIQPGHGIRGAILFRRRLGFVPGPPGPIASPPPSPLTPRPESQVRVETPEARQKPCKRCSALVPVGAATCPKCGVDNPAVVIRIRG